MIPQLQDNSLVGSEHTLISATSDDRASKRQKGHDELPHVSQHKGVSFAPLTEKYPSDRSPEDVENSWYTREELCVFKLERKALVKALKKVNFDLNRVDTHKHCLRGFEAYFSIQCNKEYKTKRQMVWDSVLQEQARQRYLGIQDPIMTQLVSCYATQWARDIATKLGMTDAQVALEIFVHYMQEQQKNVPETNEGDEEETEDSELLLDGVDLEPIQINIGDYNEGRIDSPLSNMMMKDASVYNAWDYPSLSTRKLQISENLNTSHFAEDMPHHDGPINVVQQLEVSLRL